LAGLAETQSEAGSEEHAGDITLNSTIDGMLNSTQLLF
jgi:hypothetical protein